MAQLGVSALDSSARTRIFSCSLREDAQMPWLSCPFNAAETSAPAASEAPRLSLLQPLSLHLAARPFCAVRPSLHLRCEGEVCVEANLEVAPALRGLAAQLREAGEPSGRAALLRGSFLQQAVVCRFLSAETLRCLFTASSSGEGARRASDAAAVELQRLREGGRALCYDLRQLPGFVLPGFRQVRLFWLSPSRLSASREALRRSAGCECREFAELLLDEERNEPPLGNSLRRWRGGFAKRRFAAFLGTPAPQTRAASVAARCGAGRRL